MREHQCYPTRMPPLPSNKFKMRVHFRSGCLVISQGKKRRRKMRLIRKKDWNQFEIIVRAGKLTKIATNCVQEIKDLCRFRLWFTLHTWNKIDISEVIQYPSGRICPLGGNWQNYTWDWWEFDDKMAKGHENDNLPVPFGVITNFMFYEEWLSWLGSWSIALNAVLGCGQLSIFLPIIICSC